MDIRGTYRQAFLDDAYTSLENIRGALLYLQDRPGDAEALFEAMRLFHSLKSAAAMMGQEEMSALCRTLEDRFAAASKAPDADAALLGDAMRAVETVRGMLAESAA